MRSTAFFIACLALWATGCTTGNDTKRLTSEKQWNTLCSRMPQRQRPGITSDSHLPPLTRQHETVLQHVALGAANSVVRVKTKTQGCGDVQNQSLVARATSTRSGGTGVVISSNGLILTNKHVVRYAKEVTVLFHDGAEYPVEVIVVHPRLDLAILKIDQIQLQATLPSLEPLKSGTPVVAVSCTTDHPDHCYRTGRVTNERKSLQRELDPARRTDYGNLVETTVKLEPGFSGGPLLDSQGHLVGLNVAVTGSAGTNRHRGYAIPFNRRMYEAVGQLIEAAKESSATSP